MASLADIRASFPALSHGDWESLFASDDAIAYRMYLGSDSVYVVVNRSDSDAAVDSLPAASLTDELTGASFTGPSITVPARTSLILVP